MSFWSNLYEVWGTNPLINPDTSQFLQGLTDAGDYSGTHWYSYIGLSCAVSSLLAYLVFYHFIDKHSFSSRWNWLLVGLIHMGTNFLAAFLFSYNDLRLERIAEDLIVKSIDCAGFAFTNMVFAALLYIILSLPPYPRKLSVNAKYTPWKK